MSYVGSDGFPSRAPPGPSRLALQVLVTCDPSERDVRYQALRLPTPPVLYGWSSGQMAASRLSHKPLLRFDS